MATVLGAVQVKIVSDSTQLEYDLKRAENAAKNAADNMAQAMFRFGSAAHGGSQTAIAALQRAEAKLMSTRAEAARLAEAFARVKPPDITSFVGAIPGMGVAAERFINLIPGLGKALISAFPVFGAIAFAEGLGRIATGIHDLAQEWDPVISAEKQATEGAKEFGDEILKIRKHLQEMADTRFGDVFGKSAMEANQAANKEADRLKILAQIKAAQDDISQARRVGASAAGAATVAGNFVPGMGVVAERFTKGATIDVATKTRELVVLQNKLREVESEQAALSRKSLETHLNDQVDVRDKANAASERAQKKENEGWENRYRLFEENLKQVQAARDAELRGTIEFNEKMLQVSEKGAEDEAEQRQRWTKINIDAKNDRIKQAKIDVPLATQVGGPLAGAMALGQAGIQTVQMRQAQIAEDQRLLNLAQQYNVPLGTQLNMREQILQKQIDLKAAQGQSVSQELQALDAIQAQMERMRQKAAGIAPMLHELRQIGGSVPGQLGGALAGGLVGGSPGQGIGREIRGALQGIGHQILGTVFQEGIRRLVVSLGLNTLANTLLKFVFGGAAAAQVANTAAVVANTVGQGVLTISNGALVASNVALTSAVLALTAATVVDAIIPFADGGRPPLGVPSIVGERGPELFIPDQAGRIVPNHQLAGGAGLMLPMMAAMASNSIGQMNFHAHGMTNPRDFVREVARQLPAYLKSTNPKYSPAAR